MASSFCVNKINKGFFMLSIVFILEPNYKHIKKYMLMHTEMCF